MWITLAFNLCPLQQGANVFLISLLFRILHQREGKGRSSLPQSRGKLESERAGVNEWKISRTVFPALPLPIRCPPGQT